MKTFKALIKREFWEHKGGMFYTPAIMAGIFALMMILAGFSTGNIIVDGERIVNLGQDLPQLVDSFESIGEEERSHAVQTGLHGIGVAFGFVAMIICVFYALGSLYDERKDRSILFWKSLPVSDTVTVLSKFVSITIAVPLCYFVVITAFQLFTLLYMTVLSWFGGSSGVTLWASSNLFVVAFKNVVYLLLASLWLAPLWGWLMFASSWAKKVAFLWGALPILMVIIAEGWIFNSARFAEMFGLRIGKAMAIQNSPMNQLVGGDMFDGLQLNAADVLSSSGFWGGLVVAAVFLTGAIYTRRFRDES